MFCKHPPNPRLVEQAVMNPPEGPLCHWRMFRIEYGFECGCPEGTIWLPAHTDPEYIEGVLRAEQEVDT